MNYIKNNGIKRLLSRIEKMQFSKIQIKIDGYYIRVEKEKLNKEVSVDLYDFNNKTRTDNDECICKTTE